MNKALYIVGICFSVIFFFVIGYYISEVSSARLSDLFSYSDYAPYSSFSYGSSASSLSEEAGIWNLLFLLLFAACGIVGLVKLKTKTSKILSIIAISLTGIFLLWNFLMLVDAGSVSFDEIGGAFVFFDFYMIAYTIVQLVQCNVYRRMQSNPNRPNPADF